MPSEGSSCFLQYLLRVPWESILSISSLRIRSSKLTLHFLRRDCIFFFHSSPVILTLRCRITVSVPTMHCVRPNVQLCWRYAASSIQYRSINSGTINPYQQQYAFPHPCPVSISTEHTPRLYHFIHLLLKQIVPFTLILHSVLSSFLLILSNTFVLLGGQRSCKQQVWMNNKDRYVLLIFIK